MRARAAVGGVVASLGILIIGWQVGAAGVTSPPTALASGNGSTSGSTNTAGSSTGSVPGPGAATPSAAPSTTPSGAPAASPSSAPSTPASKDGTYTGATANTPFGPVQVSVTISGNSITEVTALQLTNADGRSRQISNRAAPMLRQEVLSAQSTRVSYVSGATYTSDGYLRSVQSALDQAGF
ncbi:MAG: FMN-binding protein [Pseudolysinimonas sp.]|uniref:FMN-binding protein n=1 Tax=Pseudolysinimonas sp. TaxID=2680009 RepID=UPI003263195A